ncbi:hypothetical protein L249_6246 [Ophiocordyceps polyrhachis-furcata BCC 54312]|uniref:Topoisomerase 1-associated factor 1 n=1 Tax=Ophiocordyceps polyrhachis-furcata BCC 54312 TaxID=1330021 RepID=A0A367L1T4_9HYPO|nr:hypothetical protein L249_6246 [Ophiocordyceps polyrhachis-furcata BCC 54312]
MEPLDGAEDTVHPEVRAHINSLISALGGISTDDVGKYQLGDDALEVLRDIKRWIRFYDEKTNRMDVARCVYEANLVEGDLLPILALWQDESKLKTRMALACFEILVPLTWPMDRDKERMTVNHYRHIPVLELAQLHYKKAIINFDTARILHTAVRAALPAIAIPVGDRTARDQGIIKLILFFLRNVALISYSDNKGFEGDESQVSRSATMDAFSYQDIFVFLLTLASNMGEGFRTEDMTVMEVIYHLVKRVEIDKLFMHEQQFNKAKSNELSAMMKKESNMLNAYNRKGPTRHSRFGTMVWVAREDGKLSSLSGQDVLTDGAVRNQKMDDSKTYKPPRRGKRQKDDGQNLGPPVKLNARARTQLRSFVQEFLDAGFNPLFQHVRKSIQREAPHVMQYHRRQFFYLVAWFLEAERMRRQAKKETGRQQAGDDDDEVNSFNLVAGVLNQEMFITLNAALHESYDMKDWQELTAVMRCFTQILLTVQEMTNSGREDDEEIAENVLNRLFYEEMTYDVIVNAVKAYKDQGFDFLDAVTELAHHFLRILEAYSKQNVDLQIRSRRRTRRKKKKKKKKQQEEEEEAEATTTAEGEQQDGQGSADEDEEAAKQTSKERKFDFHRFSSKFASQGVVNTFVLLTKYYADLDDNQLKRAHRYFYRLAFKQEMGVMLFRVDIIHLLYNMIKGPEPLDKSSKMFGEWEELVKQILRKCFKKLRERPELFVELLFSKINATATYLEYGYEKQTLTAAKREPKPGAELEFKHTEERDRQIAIVVGAMLDRNESHHINWLKGVLTEAESERRSWAAAQEAMPSVGEDGEAEARKASLIPESERRSWAAAQEAMPSVGEDGEAEARKASLIHVRPDSTARRTAMFKNSHLRLLMTVSGLQRLGPASDENMDSSWIIAEDVSAEDIKDTLHYISQAEFNPPTFDEKQLRRKAIPRKKAAYDDDDDDDEEDDGILFPLGGPTVRKAIDDDGDSSRPKKTRRRSKRRESSSEEVVVDEALEEARRKRKDREREKARRIKSALYVRQGDDDFDSDEDEAFFARERAIADRARKAAASATAHHPPGTAAGKKMEKQKKRKSDAMLANSDDEDDDDDDDDGEEKAGESKEQDFPRKKPKRNGSNLEDDESRSHHHPPPSSARQSPKPKGADDDDDDDKEASREDEDEPVTTRSRHSRVRGGFVMSSDEDDGG